MHQRQSFKGMMMRVANDGDSQVEYLLINVPLTDPTAPYHSISYLVGATASSGFTNFSCLDANVEALNYLAQERNVAELLSQCAAIRAELEAKSRLTRAEQLTYRCAVKAVGLSANAVCEALAVLKDG